MAVTTSAVLAGAAAASQLAGSGMSFASARKQKRAQAQAEKEADIAMASARQSLEKNYMDSLAIQKEPYELERDAALVAGAQATEALRESERGAGRVGAIYGQQQQALRDIGTQLDLGEVTGAQLAAANAEERRQQQLQAGVAGIGGAAMTGLDSLALYGKTKTKAPSKKQVIGSEIKGLKPSDAQKSRYNINAPVPPQLPKTPLEQIMTIPPVDQSINTPIGTAPTNFMLPPERGFGSNYMRSTNTTNPFSYLAY
jgi:hypothetical protein